MQIIKIMLIATIIILGLHLAYILIRHIIKRVRCSYTTLATMTGWESYNYRNRKGEPVQKFCACFEFTVPRYNLIEFKRTAQIEKTYYKPGNLYKIYVNLKNPFENYFEHEQPGKLYMILHTACFISNTYMKIREEAMSELETRFESGEPVWCFSEMRILLAALMLQ